MLAFQDIVWLLVLIGAMILIHEFGHYWAARRFDVRIEVFSFGFGPRLFGFKRGETDFRFSAILYGGYVKMAGEQPGDENINDPRAFLAKPRWQRMLIAMAGPFMNIVLAVALLTGMYMVKFPKMPASVVEGVVGYVAPGSPAAKAGVREGDRIVRIDNIVNPTWEDITIKEVESADRPLDVKLERAGREFWVTVRPVLEEQSGLGSAGWQEEGEVQVAGVSPGMPAAQAGLEKGDILLRANGQPLRSRSRLQEIIQAGQGRAVTLKYLRDGQDHTATIAPVFTNLEGTAGWRIGVLLQSRVIMTKLAFPAALDESIRQNLKSATLIYQFLKGVAERRMSAKSISGPIKIAQLSGDAAREGPMAFLGLMTVVSLNLAIFNLLPIPILDGGVIMLLLIEMLIRRDLSLQVKEAVLKLGFVFLMAVMVFVLYNDISKILPPG